MFFETTLTRDRIDAMRECGAWVDAALEPAVRRYVVERADRPAVVDRFGTLTWGALGTAVDQAARGLLELGVRRGDVVQLQLPNWRHFPVMVVACERIGAVINPVAPIFRAREVDVMDALARPSVVVTAEEFRGFGLAAMHAELRERHPSIRHLVVVGADGGSPSAVPNGTIGWDGLLALGAASAWTEDAVSLLAPEPHDVVEVMFTSGTTGQPKGVLHCQYSLDACISVFRDVVLPGAGDVVHMASTLGHQTGYLCGVRLPLTTGRTVVLQDAWDAAEFARLIETHRINVSMGATPFLSDLLAVPDLADRDLSSFQRFLCAGAAIPTPILERARQALSCDVLPGWGMTEVGLMTVGRPGDPFEHLLTDGRPAPHTEVRVIDGDGKPVLGEEGDLQCRGHVAFIGYLQGRAVTETSWNDGWFDTGDRAIMFDSGHIRISGRTKDLVIRGGENIPVKEVEDVLLRHPAVQGIAIVGQPHDRLGEIGCACVIPTDPGAPPTLADITAHLAEQDVTRQFWPEALLVVDEFPMTPSGKVQKYVLRQRLSG